MISCLLKMDNECSLFVDNGYAHGNEWIIMVATSHVDHVSLIRSYRENYMMERDGIV